MFYLRQLTLTPCPRMTLSVRTIFFKKCLSFWKARDNSEQLILSKLGALLRRIGRYLKSDASKSIAHAIKYANFQLYRALPVEVI